jgi:hypothetical protein
VKKEKKTLEKRRKLRKWSGCGPHFLELLKALKSEKDPAVEGTAVEDTAVEDTAVEGTAVEDTAVEDTAVEDTAVEGTAVEDTAVEGTAVEDTAVEVAVDGKALMRMRLRR